MKKEQSKPRNAQTQFVDRDGLMNWGKYGHFESYKGLISKEDFNRTYGQYIDGIPSDYDAETKSQRNRRYIAIATLLLVIAGIVGYLIVNP